MSERYALIKLLGEGSYGKCFLVQGQSQSTPYVIKQIDIRHMNPVEKEETIKEAGILGSLDHPYIVKLKEAYISKKGKLCIVMDYADGGDLSSIIKTRHGERFPENQVLDWFVQLCLALKHIHDRKILHRDLKSQNIFLMKNGSIKLGDFGIAKILSQTMENAKTMVGTPYYLSPELIDNKPYNFKSDIWSLGVLLYEMCALEPPFVSNSIHGLALKIVRGVYSPLPTEYSRDLRTLLGFLLAIEPRDRPNIHQVLKMPIVLSRIQSLLSASKLKEEFSHTILHNRPVTEERSSRKKKRMLEAVLQRRKELDTANESPEKRDDEKILCEMTTLILENNIEQSSNLGSPVLSGENDEETNVENSPENTDKVTQLRACLQEMMGSEIFQEAYEIILKIDSDGPADDIKAYNSYLKHIMTTKNQKQFIPMIQALIQMESS